MAKKILFGIVFLMIIVVGITAIYNYRSNRGFDAIEIDENLPGYVANIIQTSDNVAYHAEVPISEEENIYLGVAAITLDNQMMNFTIDIIEDEYLPVRTEDPLIVELQEDTTKLSNYMYENKQLPKAGDVELDELDFNIFLEALNLINLPDNITINEESIDKYGGIL